MARILKNILVDFCQLNWDSIDFPTLRKLLVSHDLEIPELLGALPGPVLIQKLGGEKAVEYLKQYQETQLPLIRKLHKWYSDFLRTCSEGKPDQDFLNEIFTRDIRPGLSIEPRDKSIELVWIGSLTEFDDILAVKGIIVPILNGQSEFFYRVKFCKLESCDRIVIANRTDAKFCCDSHRATYGNRKKQG